MWQQITQNEQINKISIDNILLKYPNNEEQIRSTPIGDEKNSDKYKVVNKFIDSLEIESMLPVNSIGNYTIDSMKRQVTNEQLKDGSWWAEK